MGGIAYRSVRAPERAWCIALLTPLAFARARPCLQMQTWWLALNRDSAVWRRGRQSMSFSLIAGQ